MAVFNARWLLVSVAAIWPLVIPATCRAEIVVQAESKTVTPGSSLVSSFFDVYFNVPPGATTSPLAGFQIRLDLSPNNGGITLGTPENLFVAPARLAALPNDATFDTTGSDASTVLASAFVNFGSEQMIDNGDGLIRVPFTIAPGTIGTFNVIIDQQNTLLSDALGNPTEYRSENGTISVTTVPEPRVAFLLASALLLIACRGALKRLRWQT